MLYNNSNKNVWKLLSVSGQIKVLYLADYVEQSTIGLFIYLFTYLIVTNKSEMTILSIKHL